MNNSNKALQNCALILAVALTLLTMHTEYAAAHDTDHRTFSVAARNAAAARNDCSPIGRYVLLGTCAVNCPVWQYQLMIDDFNSATGTFSGMAFWTHNPAVAFTLTGTLTGQTAQVHTSYIGALAGREAQGTLNVHCDGTMNGRVVGGPGRYADWYITKIE